MSISRAAAMERLEQLAIEIDKLAAEREQLRCLVLEPGPKRKPSQRHAALGVAMSPRRQAIVAFVGELGRATTAEIAARFGGAYSSQSHLLTEMVEDRQLLRVAHGIYVPIDAVNTGAVGPTT